MSDHERTDASPGRIALAGVALGVFLIAVLGLSTLLYRAAGWLTTQRQDTRSLIATVPSPAAPLLQLRPEEELAAMRKADAQTLSEYAWESKATGAVRMPIAEAMRLLVQRGLPPSALPPVTFEQLQQQRGDPEPLRRNK